MQMVRLVMVAMLAWWVPDVATGPATRDLSVAPEPLLADTVRGIVFDSISNMPMADAFVVAEPGGALTATTKEGRFILVSPARVRKISVYHDATERLGISGLGAVRPDPSQPWTDVRVATPSMSTVWSKLCTGKTALPGMGGIIVGSARADDSTRIANAHIVVKWESITSASGATPHVDSTSVETGADGHFVLCGAIDQGEASVMGTIKGARSGVVTIPSSERSLRRVDLLLGEIGPGGALTTARVNGRVLDTLGNPVANAVVTFEGAKGKHRTDKSGKFTFPNAPTGSQMMRVNKVGYVQQRRFLDIPRAGVKSVELLLPRNPTERRY